MGHSLDRINRAIDRFEIAVLRHDELGAIPVFSDDRDEQRLIDKARRGIKMEYTASKNALRAMLVTARP